MAAINFGFRVETLEARLPMTGHARGFTRFAYPE
jgi:hypothetical protein